MCAHTRLHVDQSEACCLPFDNASWVDQLPREGSHWLTSCPTLTAQRSAQELPLVEKQSAASGPVLGGKRMVLSGHNFLQDSKVIFVEKAPGISS